MEIKIMPSILSADFGRLDEEIASVEKWIDGIHFDVMDGHFVPNLTIGAPVMKCLKTKLPIDAHLMVTNPDDLIEAFSEAGASTLSFHAEVVKNPLKTIGKIKENGMKAGIALNPDTGFETIANILDELDFVLIMSVFPGFGGQKFIPKVVGKIRQIREVKPKMDIQVDGGINAETARIVKEAGANWLVAGSYIFGSENREKAILKLK